MPDWVPALVLVPGLFGVLMGCALGLAAEVRRQHIIAIAVLTASVCVVVTGVLMFNAVYTTREECDVVGTSAEDAVYVCIEVTE